MKTYYERKALLRTRTTTPTMTDQSEAAGTDINIVLGHMLATGHPPREKEPIYGDFSELPEDLRGFIHQARSIGRRRTQLPPQLREMPVSELLALTKERLSEILTPPAPKPVKEEGT